MSSSVARTVNDWLYDKDFYAWTQEQAFILRTSDLSRLDVVHLVEEVESLGRRERADLENRMVALLTVLLKYDLLPLQRSRSLVLLAQEQRRLIARILRRNPSLYDVLDESLAEAYGDAVLIAERETGLKDIPPLCPFALEQLLDSVFMPG